MRSFAAAALMFTGTAWAVCPLADGTSSATGASIASGDTTGNPNDYTTSCGFGGGSPDVQIEYTATVAGRYTFDTFGSSHDTVLAAFDATVPCTTELECNDDTGGLQSQIEIDLVVGQTILLNVDGFGTTSVGPWVLNATWAPPPVCGFDFNLGSLTGGGLGVGDTCGAVNDCDGASCGAGQASEDHAYAWTAPSTGSYIADTVGSSFDTALTIQTTGCSELACNDDSGGTVQSSVTFSATAGDQFLIVVDGYSTYNCGPYVLNVINAAGGGGGGCPDADADGICDASDLCVGVDASGDSDSDGTCDDRDFNMRAGTFSPGQQVTVSVDNATAGARVFFFASLNGPGAGPCHPGSGVCLDIQRRAIQLGSATAGPRGSAGIQLTVPPTIAVGTRVALQAVWIDAGRGDVTEVERITIQ
jgi:hypothetical protein